MTGSLKVHHRLVWRIQSVTFSNVQNSRRWGHCLSVGFNVPTRQGTQFHWRASLEQSGRITPSILFCIYLYEGTRLWLRECRLCKASKTRTSSQGALYSPNQWHSTKHPLHPHSWPPGIYRAKDMPPQAQSAHIQTPSQRLGLNHFHWLQRAYQLAAPEIPTSKHCVRSENGKQLRRQMNARALVCRLHRTEIYILQHHLQSRNRKLYKC